MAATLFLAALILGAIAIGSIPGLHGDEAWVMLRVDEIAGGARPLAGMTHYVGPLQQYMAWPVLVLAGYEPWALRLLAAVTNAVALLFALAVLRELHPSHPTVWRWTGWLMVTSVPFVVFARFGIELTMLMPALVLAALWLLLVAHRSDPGRSMVLSAAAGGLLGLAVYNHVLAAAVVAAMIGGAVVGFGWIMLRSRTFLPASVGLLLGVLPTAFLLYSAPSKEPPASIVLEAIELLGKKLLDLSFLPFELAGMLDGWLLFQRFTGERLVPVLPFFSLTLLALAGVCLKQHRGKLQPIDRALLAAWALMPVTIVLIAPGLSLRYFHLPALLTPYLLVRLALAARVSMARGILAAVLALQIGYVAVNYFLAFSQSGGRLAVFSIGWRMTETSNHFIPTDHLYRQLAATDVVEVIGDEFIVWPLAAYDIPHGRLIASRFATRDLLDAASSPRRTGRVAIVAYGRPSSFRRDRLGAMRGQQQFDAGAMRYVRAAGFDERFVVFIGERR